MSFAVHLQAVLGLAVFVVLALPFRSDVRRINWQIAVIAVALRFAICILLLKMPVISDGLATVNRAVGALGAATGEGTSFIYGSLGGGAPPFTVANPGTLVIVMSALSALFWFWRILPLIVRAIAWMFERTLDTPWPAGLAATANVFLGQIEAPLLVRPYIATMTRDSAAGSRPARASRPGARAAQRVTRSAERPGCSPFAVRCSSSRQRSPVCRCEYFVSSCLRAHSLARSLPVQAAATSERSHEP
ncbi:MAG: Na+ dependent nucleoside transporter N-terminal domain-containing protein [Steroidobacteraceae bacterium]